MSVDFRLSTRDLTVRSGSVDVNGGDFHKIINIVLHENYDQFNAVINDIAVFEVSFDFFKLNFSITRIMPVG
jgi:hypothetical protein